MFLYKSVYEKYNLAGTKLKVLNFLFYIYIYICMYVNSRYAVFQLSH